MATFTFSLNGQVLVYQEWTIEADTLEDAIVQALDKSDDRMWEWVDGVEVESVFLPNGDEIPLSTILG